MVKLAAEEFLNVVQSVAKNDEFAKDSGFVMIKTISDAIKNQFGYTNPDFVEVQILELEKAGRLKVRREFNLILGVEI